MKTKRAPGGTFVALTTSESLKICCTSFGLRAHANLVSIHISFLLTLLAFALQKLTTPIRRSTIQDTPHHASLKSRKAKS